MSTLAANINNFDAQALVLNTKPNTSLSGGKILSKEEAQEAAQDFEAFFMTKMMESMFEGISTDGMFGGGHAEKIYRSLLLNEYGKAMAKTGTIGVSDDIMSAILKMQEANSTPANDRIEVKL